MEQNLSKLQSSINENNKKLSAVSNLQSDKEAVEKDSKKDTDNQKTILNKMRKIENKLNSLQKGRHNRRYVLLMWLLLLNLYYCTFLSLKSSQNKLQIKVNLKFSFNIYMITS